mmetsp:Transcript_28379/g.43982  ORF Transcript_28379/g.43982 Transcript_28379/m.43982 type:complete len:93 (+) Transcript_28379:43-321(+)
MFFVLWLLLAKLILSSDIELPDLQRGALMRLTGAVSEENSFSYLSGARLVTDAETFDDVCKWTGFGCRNSQVVDVKLLFVNANMHWNLDWFP